MKEFHGHGDILEAAAGGGGGGGGGLHHAEHHVGAAGAVAEAAMDHAHAHVH